MRHRIQKKHLNRSTAHRESMQRNMVCSVIKHERVVTTLPKAKAMRRAVDRVITLGKQKSLARFRRAVSLLRDEEAARKLFDVLGPRYANRQGGYTRVLRLSGHRIGDGGDKAILELVDNDVLAKQIEAAAASDEDE